MHRLDRLVAVDGDDVVDLLAVGPDGLRHESVGDTFESVLPVSLGGASAPENLQLLCGPCKPREGRRPVDRSGRGERVRTPSAGGAATFAAGRARR